MSGAPAAQEAPGARLSLPHVVGYALGSFGTGVFSTVPTMLLLYFCTQTLRIPTVYASLVVFAPKVWAIVWDPFVGVWSDATRTVIGRRRPFLLAGAAGVCLSFVGLFGWRYGSPSTAALTAGVFYFAMATAYSLFAVPYVAFPAEVSASPLERERITAWRIGFAMIGTLIGAVLAPAVVSAGGGGRQGYALMGVVIAAICGLGMGSAFVSIPSHTGLEPPRRPTAWRDIRGVLQSEPDFLRLLLAYVLQLTGVGALTALTPYAVIFVMRRSEADTGVAMGGLLLSTILTTPLWALAVRRIGARYAIIAAALLYGALTSTLAVASVSAPLALCAFAGIGAAFAGIQVAPFGLCAHIVHRQAQRTGRRQEGLMTGIWTAGEKLGLALGPAIAGLGLAAIGFVTGGAGQTPEATEGLRWLIALVPAAFVLLSLPLVARLSRTAAAKPVPGDVREHARPGQHADFTSATPD